MDNISHLLKRVNYKDCGILLLGDDEDLVIVSKHIGAFRSTVPETLTA